MSAPISTGSSTVLTALNMRAKNSCITTGYIVENTSFHLASLHAAALRRYHIHVLPENHPSEPRVHFTITSVSYIPRPRRLPNIRKPSNYHYPTSHRVLPGSSVPQTLLQYAAKSAPILLIQASILENCICVGVTVPHALLDRVGLGYILKVLDCEIKGVSWFPPSSDGSKVLDQVWEEASVGSLAREDIPSGVSTFRSLFTQIPAIGSLLSLGLFFFTSIKDQSVWVYSNSLAVGLDKLELDPTQLTMFFNYMHTAPFEASSRLSTLFTGTCLTLSIWMCGCGMPLRRSWLLLERRTVWMPEGYFATCEASL
ncbi:hypothetical protein BT96DRAFT_1019994 [Gymnopus androsaceus JB14]|uniref:Uncharacterized protein n=1 Tax=Gymnopus androsaceus JB14 TaxID=1447944 RepID=A0A6A4HNR9_9AGAR|nr:hypothetical protein BT96DRAFT_1019994 [Gymnopus androsaceus JB14]